MAQKRGNGEAVSAAGRTVVDGSDSVYTTQGRKRKTIYRQDPPGGGNGSCVCRIRIVRSVLHARRR
jgi:hypothetical protein